MSGTLSAVLLLSAITIAIKGAGSLLLAWMPDELVRRLGGLAPALLAGLVVTEVVGADGVPAIDAKLAGVAVALVLAHLRAPLMLTITAGAAVTAVLRAVA